MGFSFDIFTTISCYLMEQKLQKNFQNLHFFIENHDMRSRKDTMEENIKSLLKKD